MRRVIDASARSGSARGWLRPNTYVDDLAVKRCIMLVHRVLGERSGAPQPIKTLRGQGHRFIAVVTTHGHPPPDAEIPAATVPARTAEGHTAQRPETMLPSVSSPPQEPTRPPHASPALPVILPRHPAQSASDAERKLVTVLCGVLAHTQDLDERVGLDALHRLMQPVYTHALPEAQRYAGTIQTITTLASGQRACALAAALGDFPLQVTGDMYLGQVYYAMGDYPRAISVLRHNVESLKGSLRCERFGMANLPSVVSNTFLVYCLAEQGAFDEGIACSNEGVQIAEEADHPNSLAIGCLATGRLYLGKGELDKATSVLERGLTLCRSTHIALVFPAVAAALGYTYTLAGRVGEALRLLKRVRQMSPLATPLSSLVDVWLADAFLCAGRLEDARVLAGRALAFSGNRKERGNQAWTLQLLGEIAAHSLSSEVKPAQDHYGQALALAHGHGMRPLLAHCRLGLGLLYSCTGSVGQAQDTLAEAITLFWAIDMTFRLRRAEAALAQVQPSNLSAHAAQAKHTQESPVSTPSGHTSLPLTCDTLL